MPAWTEGISLSYKGLSFFYTQQTCRLACLHHLLHSIHFILFHSPLSPDFRSMWLLSNCSNLFYLWGDSEIPVCSCTVKCSGIPMWTASKQSLILCGIYSNHTAIALSSGSQYGCYVQITWRDFKATTVTISPPRYTVLICLGKGLGISIFQNSPSQG